MELQPGDKEEFLTEIYKALASISTLREKVRRLITGHLRFWPVTGRGAIMIEFRLPDCHEPSLNQGCTSRKQGSSRTSNLEGGVSEGGFLTQSSHVPASTCRIHVPNPHACPPLPAYPARRT